MLGKKKEEMLLLYWVHRPCWIINHHTEILRPVTYRIILCLNWLWWYLKWQHPDTFLTSSNCSVYFHPSSVSTLVCLPPPPRIQYSSAHLHDFLARCTWLEIAFEYSLKIHLTCVRWKMEVCSDSMFGKAFSKMGIIQIIL